MDVRATTRMRAVLGIFREHRKPRGGMLDALTLERDWKLTGLRHSDLEEGLRDLLRHDFLHLRVQGGTRLYELTYIGERASASLFDGFRASALRDWLILMRAKRRARQPRGGRAGVRRRNDGPPPPPDFPGHGSRPH